MTRYFQAFVTARPIVVDGQSFTFERVEPMGGSWLGVLAVDDPVAANKLAAAGYEIDQARYDSLKKKVTGAGRAPVLPQSRQPQLPPQPLAQSASPAGHHGSSGDSGPTGAAGLSAESASQSTETRAPLASVSLLTTNKKPPTEPLLDTGVRKTRRRAS